MDTITLQSAGPSAKNQYDSFFFFPSRRRHPRFKCDWSSDVCSSDLHVVGEGPALERGRALEEGPGHLVQLDRELILCEALQHGGEPVDGVVPGPREGAVPALVGEIGRASCRERV